MYKATQPVSPISLLSCTETFEVWNDVWVCMLMYYSAQYELQHIRCGRRSVRRAVVLEIDAAGHWYKYAMFVQFGCCVEAQWFIIKWKPQFNHFIRIASHIECNSIYVCRCQRLWVLTTGCYFTLCISETLALQKVCHWNSAAYTPSRDPDLHAYRQAVKL